MEQRLMRHRQWRGLRRRVRMVGDLMITWRQHLQDAMHWASMPPFEHTCEQAFLRSVLSAWWVSRDFKFYVKSLRRWGARRAAAILQSAVEADSIFVSIMARCRGPAVSCYGHLLHTTLDRLVADIMAAYDEI